MSAVGAGPAFAYHHARGGSLLMLVEVGAPMCVCEGGESGSIDGVAFNNNCQPRPVSDLLALKVLHSVIYSFSHSFCGCCLIYLFIRLAEDGFVSLSHLGRTVVCTAPPPRHHGNVTTRTYWKTVLIVFLVWWVGMHLSFSLSFFLSLFLSFIHSLQERHLLHRDVRGRAQVLRPRVDPARQRPGTALLGPTFTMLTALSWIHVSVLRRRVLPSPARA